MRILIITMSLPYPPASGGAIRVHGIVEGLYQAGHDITLLAFHEGQSTENEDIPIITVLPPTRSTPDRLRDLIFSRQPDIAGRFYSEAFAERLKQLLAAQTFDIIQFEGIESVVYLPIAKTAQPTAKLIFDTFNAEYALQQGISKIDRQSIKRLPAALYSSIQVGRIARFEAQMCQMADAVIAVSAEDAELLKNFRKDQKIHVVPNGIWVDNYTQKIEPEETDDEPTLVGQPMPVTRNTLVFTGKMDYRPNVDAMLWFTEAVFPLIRAQIPDAYLYIVGQQPHPRLNPLKEIDGIQITGWVKSVLPYLQIAGVYIAPLRMGSGTRLKLLEAMASSCAIVATSVASSGLNPETRAAMAISDDPADMAQQIITLLQNPQQRLELSKNARQQVKDNYDWPVLIPRLLAAYNTLDTQRG